MRFVTRTTSVRAMRRVLTAALVLIALASPDARAQTANVGTPVPSWVQAVEVPPPVAEHGAVEELLWDEQWRLHGAELAVFRHAAWALRTPAGVQDASRIEITMRGEDRLDWHFVRRYRGGSVADLLDPADVRFVQPEAERNVHLYSEDRVALLILEDVRVGDIIELASTRTDPTVVRQRFAGWAELSRSYPLRAVSFRATWQDDLEVGIRLHEIPTAWERTQTPSGITIRARDVPAGAVIPDDSPSWFRPTARVEVSSFESWAEIAELEAAHYDPSRYTLPEDVHIAAFAERADPLERAARALRFVQEEIRYVGLEIGAHAMQPHPPEVVLAQRYGDCKDKALLLIVLLDRLGIHADAALVHSRFRGAIADGLPSPYAFDHVVVRAEIGGRAWWLDPTTRGQRAPIASLPPLEFGRALVLRAGETGLTTIPAPIPEAPTREILEHYAQSGEDATLIVEDTYRSRDAEWIRLRLEELPPDGWRELRIRFYLELGMLVTPDGDVTIEDTGDEVRIRGRFHVPDFMDNGRRDVGPFVVYEYLREPAAQRARGPLALMGPSHVRHRVIVDNPGLWTIDPAEESWSAGPAHVTRSVNVDGERLTIDTRLRIEADHIEADDVPAYARELQELNRQIEFEIVELGPDEPAAASDEDVTTFALVCFGVPLGIVFAGIAGYFGVRMWRGRRQRAFKRAQKLARGEDPADPIEVDDLERARDKPLSIECCGRSISLDAWSTVRLGGALQHVSAATCPTCGRRHRRFFRVKSSQTNSS
jgi:hypothetical protein